VNTEIKHGKVVGYRGQGPDIDFVIVSLHGDEGKIWAKLSRGDDINNWKIGMEVKLLITMEAAL
jgi:hypothetical protein